MNSTVTFILLLFFIPLYFSIKEDCEPSYYWTHKENSTDVGAIETKYLKTIQVTIHYHKCGKLTSKFKEEVLKQLKPHITKEHGTELVDILWKSYQ